MITQLHGRLLLFNKIATKLLCAKFHSAFSDVLLVTAHILGLSNFMDNVYTLIQRAELSSRNSEH